MNLNKLILKLDAYQRHNRFLAFMHAVIKKYGDDQAGYQAALLTYYGFLSLFPLLLVVTTLTQIIAFSRPELQARVINAVAGYFPVLGGQLSAHVHSLHKSGLALGIGIVFLIYGTRGVAAAFRNGANLIWGVPRTKQEGFPKSAAKDLMIVIVGGLGFILAGFVSGLTATGRHGLALRLVTLVLDGLILFLLFSFLFKHSLPRPVTAKNTRLGAITASVGLVILQLAGGYILAHVLKNLDALYSYFALSLGLLFWIYLQAQLFYYAMEISVVHSRKLWPRSLSGHNLTEYDKRVIADQESSSTI